MRVIVEIVERDDHVACQFLGEDYTNATEREQLFLSRIIELVKTNDFARSVGGSSAGQVFREGLVPFAASQERIEDGTVVVNLLDKPVLEILGLSNLIVMTLASAMRKRGVPVPLNTPAQRAMVVSYCLRQFLTHGADWHERVISELG